MVQRSTSVLFGLVVGIVILPLVLTLKIFGRPELVYPVTFASIAIAFAVRGYWELRSHWWFWVTVTAIVCLHVPLILLISWNPGWVPAPLIMLASVVDFGILLGIISIVARIMKPDESDD
jgi:uncharacterized membrane protein (DUF485 family)